MRSKRLGTKRERVKLAWYRFRLRHRLYADGDGRWHNTKQEAR